LRGWATEDEIHAYENFMPMTRVENK